MKILFYLGHPAHFHLFKNVIGNLLKNNHRVDILIKKKDVLETLLDESGFKYFNILPEGRKDNKGGIAWGLAKRDFRLFLHCLKRRPQIMLGTSTEITHVGKLLCIPSIVVNEDDFDVVPLFSKLGYPFAKKILAPDCCKTGKWEKKSIKYSGYHELAYLHPNNFTPNKNIVSKYFNVEKSFFIIRFAKLTAHHDAGITGISGEIANKIINKLQNYGDIYITSERPLEPEFEKYRININPIDMHHVMAFAKMYIGDSQTMAAEAGVLGIPFIRFNGFVGRIGYLNELENTYKLGVGVKPEDVNILYEVIDNFLANENLANENAIRKNKMLNEKIDVAAFFTWLIENYPNSITTIKNTPDYQYNFK